MRQDPDVIMVGEIRDHETAATGVQAALTGHLLISTLHANDAIGAIARLNDLGVDNFKIGGALLGSIAQRLLRQICSECKEPIEPNEALLKTLCKERKPPVDAVYYRGRGCKKCLGTGYSGRIPIYEIMVVTPAHGRGHRERAAGNEAAADRDGRRNGRVGGRGHGAGARRAERRWRKCSTSCRVSGRRCL